jgi:hypothetical protein
LRRALDLAQGLSVAIFRPSRMPRVRQNLLVWLALLAWISGWNVHAGMALAQAAGQAQFCSSGGGRAPNAPVHGNRIECACCAQALSATTPTATEAGAARLLPVGDERAQSSRRVIDSRVWRVAGGEPRAPPAA